MNEDAADLRITKNHEVEESEDEADSGRSSHQDSWEKMNIDLVVMIKEDQQANIESHVSTEVKVGTESKI